MKHTAVMTLVALFVIAPIAASQQAVARVIKAMPKTYHEPDCDISSGHFLISSAATYLAVASGGSKIVSGTHDPAKVKSALESGIRVATDAIETKGQADNPGAWYFLGRLYLQGGNLIGADSALSKAETMAPQCKADIDKWRNRAALPLAAAASQFMKKDQDDSAMVLSRQATTISHSMPTGYYNLGIIFANAGQSDSAIKYFKHAKEIASTDLSRYTNIRNISTFNIAAMYQKAGQNAEAVDVLKEYLTWVPDDQLAKRALAGSLRAINKPDEASKIEKELLASAAASGKLTLHDQMAIGVDAFNEKKYDEAVAAFQKVLEQAPWDHDARFNLANSYLAMQDGTNLVVVGRALIESEPLNNTYYRFLAQGFNMLHQQDSMLVVVNRMLALPTNVAITSFTPKADGATLVGKATGRKAEQDGAELPAAAETIVVEFLDKDQNVVDSKTIEIPALQPDQTWDLNVAASGAGIVGWRYQLSSS